MKPSQTKREILNQFINFFWTILCFVPVIYFWAITSIHLYFYLFLAVAAVVGMMPKKALNLLLLSSNRKFYEKIGVKSIRKFVQNGDIVAGMTGNQKNKVIKGPSQVKGYLNTIAMYERYHWTCFSFFLLTSIYCFFSGYLVLGLLIIVANLLYNITSILLQQYNKIRIGKMMT